MTICEESLVNHTLITLTLHEKETEQLAVDCYCLF